MHYEEIKRQITTLIVEALKNLPDVEVVPEIHLERPKSALHGDFACNIALQLARTLKRNPRELASALLTALPASAMIARVELAGAGFINFYLTDLVKTSVVDSVLREAGNFGRGPDRQQHVQVEFVSANPTGPLHVGHGRGAAYGASLAALFDYAGYQVSREYYVNDAGRQMDILALSVWLRYLESCGFEFVFPGNAYRGDYVRNMSAEMVSGHQHRFVRGNAAELFDGLPDFAAVPEEHLDQLIVRAKKALAEDWHWVHDFVLTEQLGDVREDLEQFGIVFDKWFSEKSLFDTGLVDKTIKQLSDNGFVYEQDGAKWFRSTQFGDEKDRVVQRDNGVYTYFASDMAYHLNKFERGYDRMINVWGADHHGYIPRVKGGLAALGLDAEKLVVSLVQFAVLYRNGEKAQMSTRAGEFVTLRDLRNDVGVDACRFFYVLRKSDQHLDFDLDLATSKSNENPVYYIQYAHARIASVLKQWHGVKKDLLDVDLSLLTNSKELVLCASLNAFAEVINQAAIDMAPHTLAFYLRDLAADFHSWYNAERILVEDAKLGEARLALAEAVRQVIENGMRVLGVSCPETM